MYGICPMSEPGARGPLRRVRGDGDSCLGCSETDMTSLKAELAKTVDEMNLAMLAGIKPLAAKTDIRTLTKL